MKLFRRIYISTLTVIWVTIVFGTATFAWLNINMINSIDGLWLSATSGNELEISIDGINFSSTLDSQALSEIFSDIKFIDITTMDGKSFYTGGLRPMDVAIPNEHYLSFELYFRTTQPEKHIYLVNNVNHEVTYQTPQAAGTFVVSRGVFWIANHRFLNGPNPEDIVLRGEEGIYYGADAVRIGIIEMVNDLNPLDERDEEDLHTLIYDPSENPERGFGLHYGAHAYYMVNTGNTNFRLPTRKPNTVYSLTSFAVYDPFKALDNQSLVAELIANGEINENGRAYYVGKIQVNIWIEGWDADAFDAIANDQIRMQLQFKAARPHIPNGWN